MKIRNALSALMSGLFLVATGTSVTNTHAAMYGGNGNGAGPTAGNLVRIDETTGVGTFIGDPITPGGLSGLDFAPDGTLYGSTITGFGSASSLVRINAATGALIATIGSIGISIGDLAVNPITGVIYGIRSNADGTGNGGKLYTINPLTGVPTLVGDTGAGVGGGIDFTPGGDLYQVNTSVSHLSLVDGSVISSVLVGTYYDALGIRPTDGTFFVSVGNPGTDSIYTLDPLTGSATFIGNTGSGSPSDLTFSVPVPEPSTYLAGALLALVFGVQGVRSLRSRKHAV